MTANGSKDYSKLVKSAEELLEPEISTFTGSVPSWLKGTFLRVGPGKFDLGDFTVNHFLDGYAIISKFSITNNRVTYSKKFLQSDSYKRALKSLRPVVTEFGTKAHSEKGKGFLARFVSVLIPEMSDNGIGNIYQMGNQVFVMSDNCFFRNIDPCSLGTGEKYDGNKIFGVNGLTAHPLTDVNGDTYNIGFSLISGIKFHVVKISSEAKSSLNSKDIIKHSKIISTIPSSFNGGMAFVHSFGMTEKHIIFIEQPYMAIVTAIPMTVMKGYSIKDWMEWKPNLRNKFHIIEKETGKVIKTEYTSASPFFFLHVVNSFHDRKTDQLVIDILALDNPSILDGMYLSKLRKNVVEENSQPECQRFILPLVSSPTSECILGETYVLREDSSAKAIYNGRNKFTLVPEVLTERGCDMPCVNRKYLGLDYNYFYASGTIAQNTFTNSIRKIDVKSPRVIKEWKEDQYFYPGEAVFVQKPNSEDEDDGILIATVNDIRPGNKDFLVVIDAKSMKELGRAVFNESIPSALHGLFLNQHEELSS